VVGYLPKGDEGVDKVSSTCPAFPRKIQYCDYLEYCKGSTVSRMVPSKGKGGGGWEVCTEQFK
jgi:hypothetical protein